MALVASTAALMLQSSAQTIGSSYTSTAAKDCRVTSADEIARDLKCGKDAVKVIGGTGRAVELAKR